MYIIRPSSLLVYLVSHDRVSLRIFVLSSNVLYLSSLIGFIMSMALILRLICSSQKPGGCHEQLRRRLDHFRNETVTINS